MTKHQNAKRAFLGFCGAQAATFCLLSAVLAPILARHAGEVSDSPVLSFAFASFLLSMFFTVPVCILKLLDASNRSAIWIVASLLTVSFCGFLQADATNPVGFYLFAIAVLLLPFAAVTWSAAFGFDLVRRKYDAASLAAEQ